MDKHKATCAGKCGDPAVYAKVDLSLSLWLKQLSLCVVGILVFLFKSIAVLYVFFPHVLPVRSVLTLPFQQLSRFRRPLGAHRLHLGPRNFPCHLDLFALRLLSSRIRYVARSPLRRLVSSLSSSSLR